MSIVKHAGVLRTLSVTLARTQDQDGMGSVFVIVEKLTILITLLTSIKRKAILANLAQIFSIQLTGLLVLLNPIHRDLKTTTTNTLFLDLLNL